MQRYVRLDASDDDKAPRYQTHTLGLCCGILSAGVLVLLCELLPGGARLVAVPYETRAHEAGTDQSKVDFLAVHASMLQPPRPLGTRWSGEPKGMQQHVFAAAVAAGEQCYWQKGTQPQIPPNTWRNTQRFRNQALKVGQSLRATSTSTIERPVIDWGELVQAASKMSTEVKVKELPWWWAWLWKLPFARRGEPGEKLTLGDTMHIFRTNIEQIYGNYPSVDGAPLAEGALAGLTDGTMYLALFEYYKKYGGIYKLCFGPKSFMVVSDPMIVKHVLQGNSKSYDKGVLAEILEPIMGKGLIPADPATWKIRRRAIVPGFHRKWIDRMVTLFGEQTIKMTQVLDEAAAIGSTVDIEERLGSLALDIIGRAVFDYDFNSTSCESPVVKATISTLKEAEHRSMMPIPYWKLPFATDIIPRQVEFKKNMAMLNARLDSCIKKAQENRKEEDVESLQNRDYASIENPSMLRFMVDSRDEDVTSTQLRDDLMTMLIAGHETTASALTWAVFELAKQPELLSRLQAELDSVLPDPDTVPTLEMLRELQLTRLCIAESLRMYPEPPLLIRRAVEEDSLPAGIGDKETKLLRGMDLFLSVYNMQRSPLFWDNPDTFDPDRFLRKKESTVKGWAGFDPDKWRNGWYPTEMAADWAYLPFGGGQRKCVGDQFAMLEATVALAMLMRRYEFEFAAPTAMPDQVGTATGATIHTKNGLWMKLRKRQ